MLPKLKVLFLCTGNACRSQMAEAWARRLHGDRLDVASAGTHPGALDPRAVRAMDEAGVDLSGHRAKHVDEAFAAAGPGGFDVVVTVCDRAREACPVLPGRTGRTLHAGFDDPPRLAAGAGSDDAALTPYRRVRDEIRAFVEVLPDRLAAEGPR